MRNKHVELSLSTKQKHVTLFTSFIAFLLKATCILSCDIELVTKDKNKNWQCLKNIYANVCLMI